MRFLFISWHAGTRMLFSSATLKEESCVSTRSASEFVWSFSVTSWAVASRSCSIRLFLWRTWNFTAAQRDIFSIYEIQSKRPHMVWTSVSHTWFLHMFLKTFLTNCRAQREENCNTSRISHAFALHKSYHIAARSAENVWNQMRWWKCTFSFADYFLTL